MLDDQDPSPAVDDNSDNTQRVACLQTAKHQVGKAHDKGIAAN